MAPEEFEKQIAIHYQNLDYNINMTPKSSDYGVDIIATKGDEKIAIQVKMYDKREVNYQDVMYLYAGTKYYECNRAVIITSGKVSSEAKKTASKMNIDVIENWKIEQNIQKKLEPKSNLVNHNHQNTSQKDFGDIWNQYILPLKGQKLDTITGKTNFISDVTSDYIIRVSSKGNPSKIGYDIFEQCYYYIIEKGKMKREEINHLYPKRASAIIFAVLEKYISFSYSSE